MSAREPSKGKKKAAGGTPAKAGAAGKAPREKGAKGDLDNDTLENLQGLISKWVSIPYGIIVILVAGGGLNLAPYFLSLKDDLGFSATDQQFIKWGVIFAYYGGILAGPLVDIIGTTVAFPLAAIFSGGGLIGLAFYTESDKVETWGTVVIVSLILFVAFSCAIAAITSISTITINFSKSVGPTVAAIMITYYWVAPLFDQTIRKGYFEDVPLKNNMIATGVTMFVVYLLAALIMNENEQSDKLKKASSLTDRLGLFIYAAIAGGFIASVYFVIIVAEAWRLGVFFMALFILLNFIALGFTIQMLLGRIRDGDTRGVAHEEHPEKRNVFQMIFDIRYICLLVGTFIVIGSGQTYYIEVESVSNAIGQSDLGDNVIKAYWISLVATTLGGGMVAATFNKLINGWLFAAAAAFAAAVGFGLVFLADSYGVVWYYFSSFFVGAGVGGWWVIVPQLVLDDAGPRNFESLWGITLSVNAVGMFAFDFFFEWISEKTEPSTPSDCSGVGCFMAPYIVSGGLCLIAGGLCFVALSNDTPAGASEKKPLRANDANAKKSAATPKKKRDASAGKAQSAGKAKSAGKPKSAAKKK